MTTPFISKKAFSTTELIVAMTIMVGILGAAISGFYIYSMRNTKLTEANTQIADSIRNLTNEMLIDSTEANSFFIYDTFEKATRGDPLGSGAVGNYLVFHYTDIIGAIYKTVGYYTLKDHSVLTPKPLYKHVNYWPEPYTNVNDVPLPVDVASEHRLMIPLVAGEEVGIDKNIFRLFLNVSNKKIIGKAVVVYLKPDNLQSGPKDLRRSFTFTLVPWNVNQ